jgi:hypothetical protein
MSLAMYAAPFDNDLNHDNNEDNVINRKRQTHNKTQKKFPKEGFDQQKVNSVLENIHKNSKVDDDEENNLGNFNPPPPPESIGATRKMTTENMQNMMSAELYNTLGKAPTPSNLESSNKNMNLELNSYNVNYGDNDLINDYYKKMLPNMDNNRVTVNPQNRQYYQQYRDKLYSQGSSDSSQDILMKKLNYMITLLEEQQDEKTSNVTEEVVLYSFLGVFIIFVVDSFARAGKYVR